MNAHEPTGQSKSVWMATADIPSLPPLTGDLEVDVCIVGAGIAGLTTAYLLAAEGKKVAVLDDGPIGGGQTQRTTAHLASAIDDRYVEIERLHGEEGARLAAQSHSAAIDRIESIAAAEGIACDFERLDGYLFTPPGESDDILSQELEAARRAGLAGVERLERAPLPSLTQGACLRFPRQGQFHPLKYLAGLARAIQAKGGRLFSGTHVRQVGGGAPALAVTEAGRTVAAGAVVVATNSPINDRVMMHTKQAAYLTYALGLRVPPGSVPKALYWDTLDPYHYVRLQPGVSGGDDVLIVGGEDHKTGQEHDPAARYTRLEAWAREHFPTAGPAEYRWSGQVLETIDGLAFIGRNPWDDRNVYIATGDSGMGMTHGTIAGILLTDLILGRANAWEKLYDPSRKTVKAAKEFAAENLNVARYYGQWLTGGDVSSADDVAPGSGALVRRGLTKVAVYRDEHGVVHECSAVCPHLGCLVNWNGAEKTWDCPCHGSRFDARGHVLCGPANSDLSPLPARKVQEAHHAGV